MTPWHSQGRYIRTAEGLPVCKLAQGMEAHGPMVASAPLMLEALQSAERAMSNRRFAAEVLADDSAVREMIRAAIAAATKTEREEQAHG